MRSMVALISQRHLLGPYGDWQDVLENSYTEYMERHGIIVVPVSNSLGDLSPYMDGTVSVRGIILTGGNDVDPLTYGGALADDLHAYPERTVSSQRDRTERLLVHFAMSHGLPVFGICRGLQFINMYFGGGIVQDIERQYGRPPHKIGEHHWIEIVDERARDYLGTGAVNVNSYHHQAVTPENLAPPLRVFALEPESGIVEGLYHPLYPIAAMQFHPEREAFEALHDTRLINAFHDGDLFWRKQPTR